MPDGGPPQAADRRARSVRRGGVIALVTAAALHGVLLGGIAVTPPPAPKRAPPVVPIVWLPVPVTPAAPPEPAVVDEPPPSELPPPDVVPPEARPDGAAPAAPESPPAATTPPTPPETAEPPATAPPEPVLPPASGSMLRVKPEDGSMAKVLGVGRPGALSPSLSAMEGALDLRAEGPLSDAARAERNVERMLQSDLADDEVSAGLADDYFRGLKQKIEVSWAPAMNQLNDGGERVTQFGMMKNMATDASGWQEMWTAYTDLAKQYARGNRPTLEPARRDRLRELMRSRNGVFRFHAIVEVVVTQGPDGRVLTIETPIESGHYRIDDGVRDAISSAVQALPDPPPARVSFGRSFRSRWRLRATWTMVPPTAFLTGMGFDISPKGFTVDVPFDIKLKTNVMLMQIDNKDARSQAAADKDN